MKLITLNAWGGKLYEPLIDFLKNHSQDTDIFFFQDILFGKEAGFSPIQKGRINLFDEMKNVLSDFNTFVFRDPEESFIHGEVLPKDIGCGQAIFVKKNIEVKESGGFRGLDRITDDDIAPGRFQWLSLSSDEVRDIVLVNFHGMWQKGSNKLDTPERLIQSRKMHEFLGSHTGKKLIAGDFNMVPDGEAMSILEEGMVNLIKKYNITSTRSSHYPKEEKFADYVLVSEDVEVKDFKVFPDEISDHLAVGVDFG